MMQLSISDVLNRAANNLAVPDPLGREGLAGAIRRAAGRLAPCSVATLVRAVAEPLASLSDDESLSDQITELVDDLIAYGDLLEAPVERDTAARLTQIFCAPPTFVQLAPNMFAILGVAGEQGSGLPVSLEQSLSLGGVARLIRVEGVAADLAQLGFTELTARAWFRQPALDTPAALVERYRRKLEQQPPAGAVADMEFLDSARPVTYYKGRWVQKAPSDGYFVSRRPQRFGRPLWCFVRTQGGTIDRILDLPLDARLRGCDEAWRLQAALDAQGGSPQTYQIESSGDDVLLSFFSPVPSWAQRQWDISGERCAVKGALFGYRFRRDGHEGQVGMAHDLLWMRRGV